MKTTTLDVDNPLEIFNKIKLEAELLNANINKVEYELFDKNCYTFTQAKVSFGANTSSSSSDL